jgi:hypothetical protein
MIFFTFTPSILLSVDGDFIGAWIHISFSNLGKQKVFGFLFLQMQDNESYFADNEPLMTFVCGAPRLVYPGVNVPFESLPLGEI